MGSVSLPVRLLLLFLCFRCASGDITADAQALLRFLGGLDGASKVVNWSNTSNPCTSWHGVACNLANDAVENLQLPGNSLYGSILPNTLGSLPGLRILSLRGNKLSGPLPSDLSSCRSLRKLYLQNNFLSGPLPSFRGNSTPSLSVLNLSFNSFSGPIPSSFSSLVDLRRLFLQNNSLTGTIPSLDSRLAELNLSNNRLSGAIPSSLARFQSSDFSGNAQLCGPPLRSTCPSPPPPLGKPSPPPPLSASPGNSPKKHSLRTLDIVLIIVAGAALFLLLSACCLLWYYKKQSSKASSSAKGKPEKTDRAFAKAVDDSKDEYSSAQEPEHNKLVFFQGGQLTFDLEDLLRASAEVLGKGSFGTAYKAVLEDGPTVVVKRLKEVSVGRKEFEQQMDFVGRIRHRNLVPMRAYYYSKEEKLLVHEFLPLGSLSAALHGGKILSGEQGRGALDWVTRVKVAMATAKGIAHVHASSSGGKQLVHGDIKSSNVLLHAQHDACVSDFGLTPLFTSNAVVSRMVGYRAPEVAETRRLTQKSDVYSFGVVVLELLTGKAPSQTSAEEGMDLPRWVQSVVREEWTSEVFDRELMKFENIEEEMVQMLQVALTCVSSSPDQRPTIAEALRMIQDVRPSENDAEYPESGGINPVSSSTDDTSNESSAPPLETPSHQHQQHSSVLDPSSTDLSAPV